MATILNNFKSKQIKVVKATTRSLKGYGQLVNKNYKEFPIEIITWPYQGWRKVDNDTGNEGGTTEGIFEFEWKGDVLYGTNNAVIDITDYNEEGAYLLGWSCDPNKAKKNKKTSKRKELFIWHANYHPDGGQLFYPLDNKPFISPLALPGDNISIDSFKAFYFDGSQGLYIHPNIWHEGVFPLSEKAKFFDKQGKVHARISCDFASEFKSYLSFALKEL